MVDELLAGHARFRRNLAIREREHLARLALEGQRPIALFIGCSDSRVIPELLTDASPGQLFVVRNIANRVPAPGEGDRSVGAAIEFAVGVLGVADIIVCGHDGCGGVRAALDGVGEPDRDSDLGSWLAGLRPAVDRARASSPDRAGQWVRAVEENVLAGLDLLAETWLPRLAAPGTVRLHGWVYDLADAALRVHDGATGRFIAAAGPRLTSEPGESREPTG